MLYLSEMLLIEPPRFFKHMVGYTMYLKPTFLTMLKNRLIAPNFERVGYLIIMHWNLCYTSFNSAI